MNGTTCLLCHKAIIVSTDPMRPNLGATATAVCPECRFEHNLPDDTRLLDPAFPHCPNTSLVPQSKVTLETLLPLAYAEKWGPRKLAQLADCGASTASRAIKQYAIGVLAMACKTGDGKTLAQVQGEMFQEACEIKRQSFALANRSMTIAADLLHRLETKISRRIEKLDAPLERDGEGNIIDPEDDTELFEDVKTHRSIIDTIDRIHALASDASGLAAQEKRTIAKAGAANVQLGVGVNVASGDKPRFTIIERPPETIEES